MQGSKKVEDLLLMLKQGTRDIRKVVPYLPIDMKEYLFSDDFTYKCKTRFEALDKDKNGTLEPEELFPVILDMASVHKLSLDPDQCKRFTSIFDEEGTGVISAQEFVKFARFIMVMSYLQTEDGKRVLS